MLRTVKPERIVADHLGSVEKLRARSAIVFHEKAGEHYDLISGVLTSFMV
jgi:hypothetical protein